MDSNFDFDRCLESDSYRSLVPFHSFVRPKPFTSTPEASMSTPKLGACPRFLDLPLEVVYHVLRYCDTASLFQLMHTSSALRSEASNLFWAKEHVVFHCGRQWLDAIDYNRPGAAGICPLAASSVQSLELNVGAMASYLLPLAEARNPTYEHATARLEHFWNHVQAWFPSVRKIVLYSKLLYPATPNLNYGLDEVDQEGFPFLYVAKTAPPHFAIFFSTENLLPDGIRGRCQLWSVPRAPKFTFKCISKAWCPKRIAIPQLRLPSGPLQQCQDLDSLGRLVCMEKYGLDSLIVDVTTTFATGYFTPCPIIGCDLELHMSGNSDFNLHMAHRHEGAITNRIKDPAGRFYRFQNVPVEVDAAIHAKHDRVFRIASLYKSMVQQLQLEFGEEGTEQREQFQDAFLRQANELHFLAPGESLSHICPDVKVSRLSYALSDIYAG